MKVGSPARTGKTCTKAQTLRSATARGVTRAKPTDDSVREPRIDTVYEGQTIGGRRGDRIAFFPRQPSGRTGSGRARLREIRQGPASEPSSARRGRIGPYRMWRQHFSDGTRISTSPTDCCARPLCLVRTSSPISPDGPQDVKYVASVAHTNKTSARTPNGRAAVA